MGLPAHDPIDLCQRQGAGNVSGRRLPLKAAGGQGKENTHGTVLALGLPHMVQCINGRAQSTVQTKDTIVNQRGEGEIIEEVRKEFPHIGRPVFADAFVVEAIYLRDLTRFVIAPEDVHTLGVSDFQAH